MYFLMINEYDRWYTWIRILKYSINKKDGWGWIIVAKWSQFWVDKSIGEPNKTG